MFDISGLTYHDHDTNNNSTSKQFQICLLARSQQFGLLKRRLHK